MTTLDRLRKDLSRLEWGAEHLGLDYSARIARIRSRLAQEASEEWKAFNMPRYAPKPSKAFPACPEWGLVPRTPEDGLEEDTHRVMQSFGEEWPTLAPPAALTTGDR